ncbi:SUMF1/EgtB/PvdO family nonheme iron enzyme [Lewinella sp. W8]|uniref:SUMF1/EgtB/PvdO family nonheme iron enzyme n=1 Tax=Lewinella sp. W8 TaxID=2528208 RepID=UPI00106728E8|nr:SUMF1/EgtB/PvdO family nonheme iron enzyme [Lewinella sp. W8]MTB50333.1 SUMF1/EgtB/PvdO family nonheme iron enzyme [Lewinella sp. W8]
MYYPLLFTAIFGVFSSPGPETISPRPDRDRALFFAVNEYDNLSDLNFPISDVETIAGELEEHYGFTVEIVHNPTRKQIRDKILEYDGKYASGEYEQDGQLLIYLTGHGISNESSGNGYFVPKNGDEEDLAATAIEYDWLRSEIDHIPCRRILVTIDACFSNSFDENWPSKSSRRFGRRGSQDKDQIMVDFDNYRTRRYLTSDAEDNETPDKSQLANRIIEGLRLSNPANGYFTVEQLHANHLRKAAPTPGLGSFGSHEPAARFLFFRDGSAPPIQKSPEMLAWEEAQSVNSCEAFQKYLDEFPEGNYSILAKKKMEACALAKKEEDAWAIAKQRNSCLSYLAFRQAYPKSSYGEVAEAKEEELDCARTNPKKSQIYVAGGSFRMGDFSGNGSEFERPVRTVKVKTFYLNRTEVSNAEFAQFLNEKGNLSTGGGPWYLIDNARAAIKKSGTKYVVDSGKEQYPVSGVSWYAAVYFCNWRSEKEGFTPVYSIIKTRAGIAVKPNWAANGYRLPTEAEWEYASRDRGEDLRWAGTSSQDSLHFFANLTGGADGHRYIAPSGALLANDLGLAHMSGNVSEWCWDYFDGKYYHEAPSDDPRGPSSGTKRSLRGGSYSHAVNYGRTTTRQGWQPAVPNGMIGFRLARNWSSTLRRSDPRAPNGGRQRVGGRGE